MPSPADEDSPLLPGPRGRRRRRVSRVAQAGLALSAGAGLCLAARALGSAGAPPALSGPWGAIPAPFSVVDPTSVGYHSIERPAESCPAAVWGDLASAASTTPLPTNLWAENLVLGATGSDKTNFVYQIPYTMDVAGPAPGLRVIPTRVAAMPKLVRTDYDEHDALFVTAEEGLAAHTIDGVPGKLGVSLIWSGDDGEHGTGGTADAGTSMASPIVRGSPYATFEFRGVTPKLTWQHPLASEAVVDGMHPVSCAGGEVLRVEREIELNFATSDATWLVFFSAPTDVFCNSTNVVSPFSQWPSTTLRVLQPMAGVGVVRAALVTSCASGKNPITCAPFPDADTDDFVPPPGVLGVASPNREFADLLRVHADVYPTDNADVHYSWPDIERHSSARYFMVDESPMTLVFDWGVKDMTRLNSEPTTEVLMYALPHQLDSLVANAASTNAKFETQTHGCVQTLHGRACPVAGSSWTMIEHLAAVSFDAPRKPRKEMLRAILQASEEDLAYEIPDNYARGAGDTYFSGKMLAKLARIVCVAVDVGADPALIDKAVKRLGDGVAVWLGDAGEAPLKYDPAWGGLVSCGCDYDDETESCKNDAAAGECPALSDEGQNFGHGFYNDHHFHFGYHIYAAAVVARYDPEWVVEHHEQVLCLIRDIANPSPWDPYFPMFRHKDWYLGSSWASGIVVTGGVPYANGRNQESSAEAIHAYEAVALYGDMAAHVFEGRSDRLSLAAADQCIRLREMGRLLLATEIRSAQRYWHVRSVGSPRVYPDVYEPHVVGMLWSTLAQEQTWFGLESWKSYGIQVLPFTPISEARDTLGWVDEMLPVFRKSCEADPVCTDQGWSVLVHCLEATTGRWEAAWAAIEKLEDQPETVYETAGGNGHSRSNTLWYIATRGTREEAAAREALATELE